MQETGQEVGRGEEEGEGGVWESEEGSEWDLWESEEGVEEKTWESQKDLWKRRRNHVKRGRGKYWDEEKEK